MEKSGINNSLSKKPLDTSQIHMEQLAFLSKFSQGQRESNNMDFQLTFKANYFWFISVFLCPLLLSGTNLLQ